MSGSKAPQTVADFERVVNRVLHINEEDNLEEEEDGMDELDELDPEEYGDPSTDDDLGE